MKRATRVVRALAVLVVAAALVGAFLAHERGLKLVKTISGAPVKADSWYLAVSPDRVALQVPGPALAIFDADTLEPMGPRVPLEGHDDDGPDDAVDRGRASFLPDNRGLAFEDTFHTMRTNVQFSLWDGHSARAKSHAVRGSGDFALAPDGKTVLEIAGSGGWLSYNQLEPSLRPLAQQDLQHETSWRVASEPTFVTADTIATLDSDAVSVWNTKLELLRRIPVGGSSMTASHDGTTLLVATREGDLTLLDFATGKVRTTARAEPVVSVELSRDDLEPVALVVTDKGAVRLLDVPSLHEVARLPAPEKGATRAHFRPGCPELYVSHGPGELERWSYARVAH